MSSTATSGESSIGQGERLGAVRGLGDDGEAGLGLEHVADAGSDDRVVIGHQHADGGVAHGTSAGSTGRSTSSAAPAPRPPPNRTLPPSAPIRSRMPARPMCPSRSSRSGLTSGGPRPSSRTDSRSPSGSSATGRPRRSGAAACRRTFESASCSARNRASSASFDRGGIGRGGGEGRSGRHCGRRSPPPASAAPGRRPEVVEQRRPEVVGDAPDAPDAGVDQREGLIEPLRVRRAHAIAQQPQLHLDRAEHLRRLVVQLAGQPAALFLVLLHHAGGEPGQLDRARLEARGEVAVLERGAHLLAEGDEEAVVERGERIAGVAHEHQRADDRLAPEQRQHRGVGECGGPGLAPVAGDLRQAGLVRAREDGRGRRRRAARSRGGGTPPRRAPGAAGRLIEVERTARGRRAA